MLGWTSGEGVAIYLPAICRKVDRPIGESHAEFPHASERDLTKTFRKVGVVPGNGAKGAAMLKKKRPLDPRSRLPMARAWRVKCVQRPCGESPRGRLMTRARMLSGSFLSLEAIRGTRERCLWLAIKRARGTQHSWRRRSNGGDGAARRTGDSPANLLRDFGSQALRMCRRAFSFPCVS
jgi:hypothetical protein